MENFMEIVRRQKKERSELKAKKIYENYKKLYGFARAEAKLHRKTENGLFIKSDPNTVTISLEPMESANYTGEYITFCSYGMIIGCEGQTINLTFNERDLNHSTVYCNDYRTNPLIPLQKYASDECETFLDAVLEHIDEIIENNPSIPKEYKQAATEFARKRLESLRSALAGEKIQYTPEEMEKMVTQKNIESLQGRVDLLTREKKESDSKVSELSTSVEQLTQENSQLSAQNQQLSEQNIQLSAENTRLKLLVTKLKSKLQSVKDFIGRLGKKPIVGKQILKEFEEELGTDINDPVDPADLL